MNKIVSPYFVIAISICLSSRMPCYSHDGPVHKKITESAFGSSASLSCFLIDNLKSQFLQANPYLYCSGTFTPLEWLREGSYYEDEQLYGALTLTPRPLDHFYTVTPQRTPGQVIGLTDGSEHPTWDFWNGLPSGIVNSYVWVTQNGVSGTLNVGPNIYQWSNARSNELASLTNSTQSARNENMALMLYSLGHVLHLNQDLTSPDHVRNDNHFDDAHRFIEIYGTQNYIRNPQWFNQQPHGWAYWQSQGFSKLLDFWDTGKYAGGSSDALVQEAAGNTKLGLAEFSNGNFLGEDALYPEAVSSDAIHSFPFPSINSSTTFPTIRSQMASGVRTSFLKNKKPINRIYISKNGDGISVTNHCVLNYLEAMYPRGGSVIARVGITVNDPAVLQDYHEILIPKAVEYSAGVLDYFFRGQLDLSIYAGANTGTFVFSVTNTSTQDFQGGSFTLLKEDNNGNRTIAGQYAVNGTIANGSSTDIQYTDTTITANTQFFLVYKGTIGVTSGSASDPVDAGIALASKKFGVYANGQFELWKCWDWEWSYFGIVPANYAFSPVSVADANNLAAVKWQEDNGYPSGSNCL